MTSLQEPARSARASRLRQSLRLTLLDQIVEGELQAGEPIKESRLAAQLKVSRTPLREALLQLEREGFIRSDQRRGFSVERLSARQVREIYPMIWALGGLAVRSSAVCAHLLAPELARINSGFAKARDPQQALALDTLWHEHLMSQSQNRRLLHTLSALRLTVRRYETVYMADTRLIPESVSLLCAFVTTGQCGAFAGGHSRNCIPPGSRFWNSAVCRDSSAQERVRINPAAFLVGVTQTLGEASKKAAE